MRDASLTRFIYSFVKYMDQSLIEGILPDYRAKRHYIPLMGIPDHWDLAKVAPFQKHSRSFCFLVG